MISRMFFIAAVFQLTFEWAPAQEPLMYQIPPPEITRIVDAPPTPEVSVSPDNATIVLITRPGLISIEDLSAEELRLAGLRIDPSNNGRSRLRHSQGFKIMDIDGTNIRDIGGMPEHPRLGSAVWSANGKKFAFTNTNPFSIELWICDVSTLKARKIADNLNAIFGTPFQWLSDNVSILYSVTNPARGAKPAPGKVPKGPVVQENIGRRGQVRTYQDLLKDPDDEMIFEYYSMSQLMLWNGSNSASVGRPAIMTDISPSPDGKYVLTTTIDRPFSYMVPYDNFPHTVQIWDMKGNRIRTLLTKPLVEDIPRAYDAVLPGPRLFKWRGDKPATVYWVEALDSGNYENQMQYHDQVYVLDTPFNDIPAKLIATEMRYSDITWGKDDYALITESLRKTRKVKVSSFEPSNPQKSRRKIHEHGSDDRYSNPGTFMTAPNSFGMPVLLFADRGKSLFLTGTGASPEGDRPFIDKYVIASGKTTRLWRSEAPYHEAVESFIDLSKGIVLTTRQSITEVPNYFIRNLNNGKLIQITKFKNPYPDLAAIRKELVTYKRDDGVDLSFTLYLPPGYTTQQQSALPTMLWAYPRDFIDPAVAGQVRGSPYTFTRISPESPLVYLTQGYAVLMDVTFPILMAEGKEPNDTYIGQLIANAKAAINKAVEMGVTDPKRVAVSGHSYGAFMTGNLLANSRLFAAGIGESGAYNRTLTPFGFQSERRIYWDVPALYNAMSPFMRADQVKDPLLLIHGTADNNEGTFPMQSERFYAALKGFGATVRIVLLPYESHGYAARESILHKHWEVLNWMDKYVKHRNIE
ncbi:MAG: prolyl oligopeptidase family serine peptidase [Cyclobacteriaceae bacterium]